VDEEVVNPAEAATRSAFRRYKQHEPRSTPSITTWSGSLMRVLVHPRIVISSYRHENEPSVLARASLDSKMSTVQLQSTV